MSWPQATQYSAVIQAPAACFSDPELKQGRAAVDNLFGLPLAYAGNFANVYKVICPNNQAWAVKCFTRPAADRRLRYQRVSRHLEENKKRFVVEHVYLDEGILVDGSWYPIVKMRWVEGHALNDFVRAHAANGPLLEQLAELWRRLADGMREINLAHGDLQHGNVLLVPVRTADSVVVRLIDYDGLWVPSAAEIPPGEVGHANYQHPERLRNGAYSPEIDRFSNLLIYTAMRCLASGGKALWDRFDCGENLLFREADLREPSRSRLLPALLSLPDASAQTLVGHLVCASQGPLAAVPDLGELVAGRKVAPLSREQAEQMARLLPPRPSRRPAARPNVLTPVPEATPRPELPEPGYLPVQVLPTLRPAPAPAAVETAVASPEPPARPPVGVLLDVPFTPPPAPAWPPQELSAGPTPAGLFPPDEPDRLVTGRWRLALVALALLLLAPVAWRWRPRNVSTQPASIKSVGPVRLQAGKTAEVRVSIDRGVGHKNAAFVLDVVVPHPDAVEVGGTGPVPSGEGTIDVPITLKVKKGPVPRGDITLKLSGPAGAVMSRTVPVEVGR